MSETSYKYWAFISYSHQDQTWGDWLHRGLETYRVPRRLVGRASRDGAIPRRLFPIFRDRAELPSSADLGGVINEALRQSRYLIVICSPHAAASRWVDGEIRTFKSFGRADRVLHLIVHGEPNAGDHPESGLIECLPLASRFHVDRDGAITAQRAEPVAADARGGKDGRGLAKLKLIAGLLDVSFDELRQRERRRQRRHRLAAVAAALALLSLSFSGWRWQQNEKQRALAQQELKTHIAQVYESGRQELLAHNEARAAVYLNEAYRLGIDTPALRFMLGRAMRTVDAQVRRIDAGKRIIWINWSADGQQLLTVDGDYKMRIWNPDTGARLNEIDPGQANAWCSGFSPAGSMVWAQTWDRQSRIVSLRVWDAKTAELRARFEVLDTGECAKRPINSTDTRMVFVAPDKTLVVAEIGHPEPAMHLAGRYSASAFCGSDKILAGATDGEVSLHDAGSGHLEQRYLELANRPIGAINAFTSTENCALIAAGAKDGALRVWNGVTGELMMSSGQTSAIRDLWLDREGASLMSTASNGATIWDTRSGALIYSTRYQIVLDGFIGPNPNGENFAQLDAGHFRIVDPRGGSAAYGLDGHTGAVSGFAFSAEGNRMATGGADDGVVIWRLPEDLQARFPRGGDPNRLSLSASEPAPATAIAFNDRQDKLFIGGDDGKGELREVPSLKVVGEVADHAGPISAAAFSADGRLLATGGWDQRIVIRNLENGTTGEAFEALGARIQQLAFAANGSWLSASLEGHRKRIWNLRSGNVAGDFENTRSSALAFTKDGNGFAIGIDGMLKLWDLAAQSYRWSQELPFGEGMDKIISFIRVGADGNRILATARSRRIFLVDAHDGHLIRYRDVPASGAFTAINISDDGLQVALGDVSRAFIWRLADDQIITLDGHIGYINAVAFSPDSKLLYSAGDDGSAKVWDTEAGVLLDTVAQQHGAIGAGLVLDRGENTNLLLGGGDNSASLWRIPQEKRSPPQIASLLKCRVPWTLQGSALVSSRPATASCEPPS